MILDQLTRKLVEELFVRLSALCPVFSAHPEAARHLPLAEVAGDKVGPEEVRQDGRDDDPEEDDAHHDQRPSLQGQLEIVPRSWSGDVVVVVVVVVAGEQLTCNVEGDCVNFLTTLCDGSCL